MKGAEIRISKLFDACKSATGSVSVIESSWIEAENHAKAVLAKITHHDYSNKIKDKMAKFTKR